jgi:F like protein
MELIKQLIGDDGKLKSFARFKKDTEDIVNKNHKWLETEYDTALLRARNAAQWKEFERDADLYPNLKWTPSTSAERRKMHQLLYGMILPITHSFWKKHFPGDLWNCKCGITNTDEKAWEKIPDIGDGLKPDRGLDSNPALTGELFTKTHPYITKNKKTAKLTAKTAATAIKADKKSKQKKR